ncbi:hypothetical protein [Streptomyces sp. NPDC001815]|uniref:hypothetical protein n=1 Tax=Streptomyces sp. NPDC001815 TaxID=3154526 RepID=UPI003325A9A2
MTTSNNGDSADPESDSTDHAWRERATQQLRRVRGHAASGLRKFRSALASNGFIGGVAVGLIFLLLPLLQDSVTEGRAPLLHASAQVPWDLDEDGATWVFTKQLREEQVRKIQSAGLAYEKVALIAQSYGGVRVSEGGFALRVRVVLRGARSEPTLIEGMGAKLVRCRPAPTGALVRGPLQGGGPVKILRVDLDAGDHKARAVRMNGSFDRRPYFTAHFHELAKGESIVYEVRAATRRQCTWKLAVQVRIGETTSSVEVDDSGAPFVASSIIYNRSAPYKTCLASDNETGYMMRGAACQG